MNRTPPPEVRAALRQEVGFGCPAPLGNGERCGNPYLYYHHFDPPWREREHHDPAGMIALCGEHHPKADAGTFTAEELREFKQDAGAANLGVRGRFDWMRTSMLAVVGGNFYYETPIPLQIHGTPVISFDRDPDGRFLLNVNMPSTRPHDPRMLIIQNDWIETGKPTDLESPPSGRVLRVEYDDGDRLRIEFRDVSSEDALLGRYPDTALTRGALPLRYPLLTVIISLRVGKDLDFSEKMTRVRGLTMTGSMSAHCGVGFAIG